MTSEIPSVVPLGNLLSENAQSIAQAREANARACLKKVRLALTEFSKSEPLGYPHGMRILHPCGTEEGPRAGDSLRILTSTVPII
jgi:hypothetical protein